MTLTAPLDLETLLVANFAGSAEIFLFVAIIVLSFLAGKLRIPNGVSLSLFAIFVMIMAGTVFTGTFTGLYVTTLAIAALFVSYAANRLFP